MDYSFDPADTIIARLSVQDSYGSNLIILKIYHKGEHKLYILSTMVYDPMPIRTNQLKIRVVKYVMEYIIYPKGICPLQTMLINSLPGVLNITPSGSILKKISED